MPRKYKPIELPLKPVTGIPADLFVKCPRCESRDAAVLGRLNLRLVFGCQECRARFFRLRQSTQDDQAVMGSMNHGGWVRVS